MKSNILLHTLKITIVLSIAMAHLGEAQAPNNNNTSPLKQWYLSTGNWGNDPQIYVQEIGNGAEPVIMLHGGWGGEHSGMLAAMRGLEDEFRFVFYDQRGSLRSPFPDSLITFEQHINDLELLRKELDFNKVTIVGHSMGGVLASAYASKYPQHIKKLLLISPAALRQPFSEEDNEIGQQQYAASQEFQNRAEIAKELAKYSLNTADSLLNSREKTMRSRINFGKLMLYDISKWTELRNGRGIYKGNVFNLTANTYPKNGWDYFSEFKKQNYPVSIIIGDHDWLDFGNNLNKKWAEEVARIKFKSLKNAGHIPWIDQPAIFEKEFRTQLTE